MLQARYITPELLLKRGLNYLNQKNAEKKNKGELGDRRKYIGASDLCGCPRRKLRDKFFGEEDTFTSYMNKRKGHLAENLILPLFLANEEAGEKIKVHYQLEFISELSDYLRCHYDFVVETELCYYIVEMKTASHQTESSYTNQIQAQIGLFEENKEKDKPVYGQFFFLDLMSGDKRFGREIYEYNHKHYLNLIKKSDDMGEVMEAYAEEADDKLFDSHAIDTFWCQYCPDEHFFSCPKQEKADREALAFNDPEYLELAEEYAVKKAEKEKVEKEFNDIKKFINTLVPVNQPTKIGEILFKKSVSYRENIDKKKIKKELFPMAEKFFYKTKVETLRDKI